MQLEMTERQIGAVTILDLAGKLTIDQGAERLRDKVNSLIQQHLLDLARMAAGKLELQKADRHPRCHGRCGGRHIDTVPGTSS